MTHHQKLRPVTVSVPGDVLLDVDGTPLAVGDTRHYSGSLYGWDHLITDDTTTTTENEENAEMTTTTEQDDYTRVTPEDMEAFRQMLSTTEADTAKWKALSRKNEADFKRADAELADARQDAAKWKALSRKNEDRRKAARAEQAKAQEDAARWERRTNHHLAVVTALRQQNADLLNRLIAEGK